MRKGLVSSEPNPPALQQPRVESGLCEVTQDTWAGGRWRSRRRAPARKPCWDCQVVEGGERGRHGGHFRDRGQSSQALSLPLEAGVGCS